MIRLLFAILFLTGCDYTIEIEKMNKNILELQQLVYNTRKLACIKPYDEIEVGEIVCHVNCFKGKRRIVRLNNGKYTLLSIESDPGDITVGEVATLKEIADYMKQNKYLPPIRKECQ